MKRWRLRRTHVVLVAFGIVALSAGLAARGESRRFALTLSGSANPTPTPDPCMLTNSETGTGHGTIQAP